jgi:DNA gyrase/topoisomerase IV subunit A
MTFTVEPQVSYERKNSPNIKRVISTTSFGTIFVFTSYGKYYGISLKKLIKENGILSMFSYLNLDYDEQILDIAAAVESNAVTFVTRNAKIKVTPFDKLIKSRYQKNGKQLIVLDDNDVVISATTNKKGEDDTFVISNKGYVLRRKYYRPTGIGTKGNIMKKLTSNEYIMFAGDTKDYTDKQIGIYEEDAVLPMMLDIFDIKPSITPSGKGKCITNNESTIDKIAIFNK